jgi:stalled ribosome rescue protein Dom34
MTTLHAVVRIDHQSAQVLQFDAEHVESQKIKAHTHHTRQHGSAVRTEHEFYGHVADALAGVAEVLVVGPGTAHLDFNRYCEKHRPQTARHIVASEAIDHPTDAQLVALARKYFLKHDRMEGTPTPTPT